MSSARASCAVWAILLMAAFAVAISTRLTVVVNVAVCSGMFLLGLLSQYLFMQLARRRAEAETGWRAFCTL